MRSLLLKEWSLYRVFFIIIFCLMLWMTASVLFAIGSVSPILFAVPFLWLAPVSMTIFEFKNESEILINSLPVTRREVVLSKYVILMLFSMASAGFLTIVHILLQLVLSVTFFPASPVAALIVAYAGIGLFLSVYLPLHFVAGPRFMLFAAMWVFLLGFIGLLRIAPHVMDLYDRFVVLWQQYAVWQWSLGLFSVTTVLLLLSWVVTTRIYEAKNL